MRNGKRETRGGRNANSVDNVDDDIDLLFRAPLAEFTSTRNTLAARLKEGGRQDDAQRVKLLSKPSISVWAVNQLYWLHREAFDQLIASGKRIRQAQTSSVAGKGGEIRESLEARRDALSHLVDLATDLLRDSGHKPAPETMRRITTTLEAMSAYASLPEGQTPGRLTRDLDPPSFEALSSFMSGPGTIQPTKGPTRITASPKASPTTSRGQKTTNDVRRLAAERQAKLADAKSSLQEAKRLLANARSEAQDSEAAVKKANAEAKQAEKHRREVKELLEQATAAAEDATRRAQTVAAEVKEAMKVVDDAKRSVEKATKELESLLRGKP
jgi:flagellar biosynthesis GTPase FlhF